MHSRRRWLGLGLALVLSGTGCEDPLSAEAPMPAAAPPPSFELSGTILGPASGDDDADMRVELRETGGGEATLNFVRVTCTNGVRVEWGAGGFVAERGTNRILAYQSMQFVRHYRCPDSSRPIELLANLTNTAGESVNVFATPTHPDWSR